MSDEVLRWAMACLFALAAAVVVVNLHLMHDALTRRVERLEARDHGDEP